VHDPRPRHRGTGRALLHGPPRLFPVAVPRDLLRHAVRAWVGVGMDGLSLWPDRRRHCPWRAGLPDGPRRLAVVISAGKLLNAKPRRREGGQKGECHAGIDPRTRENPRPASRFRSAPPLVEPRRARRPRIPLHALYHESRMLEVAAIPPRRASRLCAFARDLSTTN